MLPFRKDRSARFRRAETVRLEWVLAGVLAFCAIVVALTVMG